MTTWRAPVSLNSASTLAVGLGPVLIIMAVAPSVEERDMVTGNGARHCKLLVGHHYATGPQALAVVFQKPLYGRTACFYSSDM